MSSICSYRLSHYPTIGFAARLRSFFQITHSEPSQNVMLQLISFRLGIDAEYTRRVQSEDIFLHLTRQKLIVMLLDQLIRNLEPSKSFDLPLRGTIPHRVHATHQMINP